MVMESANSEILALPGGPTRVEWRRSTRARRVSLRIDPREGGVVVTLPHRAARTAGMALLMTNADWVSERLAALPGAVVFVDGAEVPLHGEMRPIRHRPGARGGAWLAGNEIHVSGDPTFLARRVADFLRVEARRSIVELVAEKALLANARPGRITIKDTSSRWGSCAANRNLAFSWRLVMAPRFVQDYVTAHEVAHLRHMNHGPHFWELVSEITPFTQPAVDWLRTEGVRLLRVG
jgi:predicted metal-dependent hydrolase